jgi:hypothetical protein
MYRLICSGRHEYLFDGLQFGWSARLFNIIRTLAGASSFFVQGAMLWNGLPPAVRKESSLRTFRIEWIECLLFCVDLQ